MYKQSLEIWVGLFVVVGVLALSMLAFKVGNLGSIDVGQGYRVFARFDNIGGLTVKAPVTMAGVRIGRVSAIRLDKDDYSAVVELSIAPTHNNLPTDTSAAILTSGLLGAQFVGLEAGGDEKFLKEGDRILLTQSAVMLEQLIGQLIFSKADGGK